MDSCGESRVCGDAGVVTGGVEGATVPWGTHSAPLGAPADGYRDPTQPGQSGDLTGGGRRGDQARSPPAFAGWGNGEEWVQDARRGRVGPEERGRGVPGSSRPSPRLSAALPGSAWGDKGPSPPSTGTIPKVTRAPGGVTETSGGPPFAPALRYPWGGAEAPSEQDWTASLLEFWKVTFLHLCYDEVVVQSGGVQPPASSREGGHWSEAHGEKPREDAGRRGRTRGQGGHSGRRTAPGAHPP